MLNEWQKRRSDLNHRRLGNQFRTTFGNAVNVLKGKVRWSGSTSDVLLECITEWRTISTDASSLLTTFEEEMSPRFYFNVPPLHNCDSETQSWLPQLIHELWLRRYPITTWVADAQVALRQADSVCAEINTMLPAAGNAQALPAIILKTTLFQEACDEVVERISVLPHILLVS